MTEIKGWTADKLFSTTEHGSEMWETPDALFAALDDEFGFDLDASAKAFNAKVPNYISPEEDALSQDWSLRGSVVWLNPPYGRGVRGWLRKAHEEALKGLTVVVLIFARTDTGWWHDYATKAREIRLIRGRLHFKRADGHTGPSTAPSALLIFDDSGAETVVKHVELPRGK